MANVNLVNKIAVKKNSGATEQHSLGVGFDNVIDIRNGTVHHSLQQFYDSYMKFMKNKNTGFVYRGSTQPKTDRVCIWLDTSQS